MLQPSTTELDSYYGMSLAWHDSRNHSPLIRNSFLPPFLLLSLLDYLYFLLWYWIQNLFFPSTIQRSFVASLSIYCLEFLFLFARELAFEEWSKKSCCCYFCFFGSKFPSQSYSPSVVMCPWMDVEGASYPASHSQFSWIRILVGGWKWKRKASVVLFVPHPLRKIISTVFFFVFLDAVVVVIPLHGPPHVLAVDDVEGHRIRLWDGESLRGNVRMSKIQIYYVHL